MLHSTCLFQTNHAVVHCTLLVMSISHTTKCVENTYYIFTLLISQGKLFKSQTYQTVPSVLGSPWPDHCKGSHQWADRTDPTLGSALDKSSEVCFNNDQCFKPTVKVLCSHKTYVLFGDEPDIIHMYDLAFMVDLRNSNGLRTDLRGHIFVHLESQLFQHQVT